MLRIPALCLVAVIALSLAAGWASADVLTDLATQRDWIGYTPRNFNPNIGMEASQTSIRSDLQQLYDAGWRRLYNYTIDGNQRHVPRISKEIGFEKVLAGVFYFDAGQLAREKSAAQAEDQHIDGYLVGNEGLAFGRYNPAQLISAMEFFAGFGKPITTTEVSGLYLQAPELIDAGHFASINIQPWFNSTLDPNDPVGMAQAVRDEYVAIKALRPDRLVVIKEAWWPTGGHPGATEANQTAFYQALADQTDAAGDPILFQWGESHDQPWKNEASPFGTLGPDWGLYKSNGTPKAIVSALDDLYTSGYPVNFLAGDFDRNGVVNEADFTLWQSDFGKTVDIAGSRADGNSDRVIDAADYTVWRDALAAGSAAIPEPGAAVLVSLALTTAHFRRRRFFPASDSQTRRA